LCARRARGVRLCGKRGAPTCEPVRHAQRTDGQGQAVLVITPQCRDAEHDTLFVHAGGGPGAFELLPELTGGYATYWLGADLQYRTAAATGTEVATYWAVDEFGARSQDAPITLAFGPDANLPAECYLSTGDPRELVMRPGVPRNFGLYCKDPEEDAFTLRLGTPPQRGALTSFAPEMVTHHGLGEPIPGYQRVDLTYVPGPASTGQDGFTVVAETAIDSVAIPITLRSAVPEEDSPPYCAHANPVSAGAAPVDIESTCVDAEGDQVQARITTPPVHGTAEPPVVAPGRFGMQRMTVRYTPAPGSGGRDRVGVTIAGFGELFFEVAGPEPPPLPPAPPPPPAPGQRTAADRAAAALGVRTVRLLRHAGVARIYAPRQGVRRVGGRPALAVVCARRCRVHARTRYAQGQRIAVRPARVGVITLPWGALSARSITRLTFTLRIRANGHAPRRVAVALRFR
jgi:hypothetical protein